jgi:hypothetical protein
MDTIQVTADVQLSFTLPIMLPNLAMSMDVNLNIYLSLDDEGNLMFHTEVADYNKVIHFGLPKSNSELDTIGKFYGQMGVDLNNQIEREVDRVFGSKLTVNNFTPAYELMVTFKSLTY